MQISPHQNGERLSAGLFFLFPLISARASLTSESERVIKANIRVMTMIKVAGRYAFHSVNFTRDLMGGQSYEFILYNMFILTFNLHFFHSSIILYNAIIIIIYKRYINNLINTITDHCNYN